MIKLGQEKILFVGTLLLLMLFSSCKDSLPFVQEKSPQVAATNNQKTQATIVLDKVVLEVDEIYSLLAYSVVCNDWQEDDRNGRGYNIGSILVNPQKQVVSHALNCVNQLNNGTQHGEVRLMTSYLDSTSNYSLNNYTIYTTLEPCAMCAGMMIMVSIERTVYGQNDLYFAKALERFSIDTKSCGGYESYPRTVLSQLTPSSISTQLDTLYKTYISEGNKAILTKFLSTATARKVFEDAEQIFLSYHVRYPQNKKIYDDALAYYKKIQNLNH